MRAPDPLSQGLKRAPDWDCINLQNFSVKKHLHERRTGLPVRDYNSSCGKSSLIAQLHSQGQLTTPRHENQKIRPEIKMFKANEPAPYV
jgi:hypothetical protein